MKTGKQIVGQVCGKYLLHTRVIFNNLHLERISNPYEYFLHVVHSFTTCVCGWVDTPPAFLYSIPIYFANRCELNN